MNDERALRIGGIYFELFRATKNLNEDKPGSEGAFDALIRELEGLEVTQDEITKMIAATDTDPESRKLFEDLYINQPSLKGETVERHIRRVLGDETFEALDGLA